MTLDTEKHFINFRITNSPLADERFISQEVCIRHEINRLLFEYFEEATKYRQIRTESRPSSSRFRQEEIDFFPYPLATSTESCIFATCKLKPFFMYTNKQIWSVSYPIL